MLAFLAYRNIIRRKRRYLFILSAMALAFAVITILTGISTGAMEALRAKAARYFAGHISITGFKPGLVQQLFEPEQLVQDLRGSGLPIQTLGLRTIYYSGDAQLFYEGKRVQQRRLIGLDPEAEKLEFADLDIRRGSFSFRDPSLLPGILISQGAAALLGCQVGDALTISLRTLNRQVNSAQLVVTGIFSETSLFGYAAYMDRRDLNRLMGAVPDYATDLALYTPQGTALGSLSTKIRRHLSSTWHVAPLYKSREERDVKLSEFLKDGSGLVILTQDAQLAQIEQFTLAFLSITYLVLVLFLMITMTGVVNTYRVLIHERKKEIGVLRALGCHKPQVLQLFLWEALELSVAACFLGFLLGLLSLAIIHKLDLSMIPGSGLVLEKGHLRLTLSPPIVLSNMLLLSGATVMAVLRPALQGSRIAPVEAMRGGA